MNKSSDHLFKLIKSLTKTEKRYFKRFSQLHVKKGKNNYIRLFDAISDQKTYEEEKIKKLFAGTTFIHHLPSEKNYLYNMILKSLRLYNSNKDVDFELTELLDQAKILYNKGLFDETLKLINKGKAKAKEHERFLYSVLFEKMERNIFLSKRKWVDFKIVRQTNKNISRHIELEENLHDINSIIVEFLLLNIQVPDYRSKKSLKRIQELANNPLLKSEKNALSISAKTIFYNIQVIYYSKLYDKENEYLYSKKYLEILESNNKFTDLRFRITGLYNFWSVCYNTKRYAECELALHKLKMLPVENIKDRDALFYRVFLFEISMSIAKGQFNEGIKFVETSANKFLHNNSMGKDFYYFEIIFNIGYLYFGAGRYADSLLWLNKILNENSTQIKEDVAGSTKILSMITHFELGNQELLEYTVKSIYRWLHKRNRLFKFEMILLKHIRLTLPKIRTNKDLVISLKEIRLKLIELSEDVFEKEAFSYFDFISWMDSKIENKSFAQIVREKFAAHHSAKVA